MTDRVLALKKQVESARPGICPERALLWTEAFQRRTMRKKHPALRSAEALCHVLDGKSVTIHPGELLVGNFTSRRVGGRIQPDLAGLAALLELHAFPGRKENPLEISPKDRLRLARILPFWLPRSLAWQACPSLFERPASCCATSAFWTGC